MIRMVPIFSKFLLKYMPIGFNEKGAQTVKLEQYRQWEEFVQTLLWPTVAKYQSRLQSIWDEIIDLFEKKELDLAHLTEAAGRIDMVEVEMDVELRNLDAQMGSGQYGPIIQLMKGKLGHDIPKIPSAVSGYLQWLGDMAADQEKLAENFRPNYLQEAWEKNGFSTQEEILKFFKQAIDSQRHDESAERAYVAEYNERGVLGLVHYIRTAVAAAVELVSQEKRDGIKTIIDCGGISGGDVMPYEGIVCNIITELVRNAIDSLPWKGGAISVRARKEKDQYVIEVEDTGSGIAAEDIKKIFEKGFTTKSSGTGQGLFFAREIVEQLMHGAIKVESEVGKGTKIVITVPSS